MKIFKRKSSNSGFGHIELIVGIVVVLALCGAGYYVWNHNKATNTSHAGSWTSFGQVSYKGYSANLYACVDKVSSTNWIVKTMATSSSNISNSGFNFWTKDFNSQSVEIGGQTTASWTATLPHTANLQLSVNPAVTNLIWPYIYVGGAGVQLNSLADVRAGSLSQC